MEDNHSDSEIVSQFEEKPANIPYSTISSAFGLFGLFLVATIIVTIPIAIIQNFVGTQFTPLLNFMAYTLSMVLILLITIKKRKSLTFLWRKVPVFALLLCIPLVLSMGIIIEPFVNLIPMSEFINKLFKDLIKPDVFSFLMVVISAPVLEELVFRGVVLEGMLKRYSPQKAIFWSSFIFGLIHLNPWQFIGAFAIGLILGWVYMKTKSLWPCILMHMVNNLFGFLFLVYYKDSAGITFGLLKGNSLYLQLYGLCIPLFALCLYALYKTLYKKNIIN